MQIKKLKTKDLNSKTKKKIFNLKNQSWKFNLLEQKKWFKKNIHKEDFHILLEIKKRLIGYNCLRLKKIGSIKFFLLDTIVIDTNYRFREIGSLLINYNKVLSELNNYYIFLKSNSKTKNFYIKNNFKIIFKNKKKLFFIYGKKFNKNDINKIIKNAQIKYS
jgi:hypothetical protein